MPLVLDEVLKVALKGGASDIHLKSGLPPMFRVDGARDGDPVQTSALTATQSTDRAARSTSRQRAAT